MSLATTKNHLIQLLDEKDNKVIALSGKWGTGKSHLWREVKAGSADEKVKAALYVSLFGLASMDQVKLKIVQSSIPNADENPDWWDKAKKGWGAASKLLESVHKGFSALNEIALLAVPSILKDRVIVLDDIERKHEKLSVDEVMGFIDEFTQQHGARIILILNSDQLADKKMWETALMFANDGTPESNAILEILLRARPNLQISDWRGRTIIDEAKARAKNSGRNEMRHLIAEHYPEFANEMQA